MSTDLCQRASTPLSVLRIPIQASTERKLVPVLRLSINPPCFPIDSRISIPLCFPFVPGHVFHAYPECGQATCVHCGLSGATALVEGIWARFLYPWKHQLLTVLLLCAPSSITAPIDGGRVYFGQVK